MSIWTLYASACSKEFGESLWVFELCKLLFSQKNSGSFLAACMCIYRHKLLFLLSHVRSVWTYVGPLFGKLIIFVAPRVSLFVLENMWSHCVCKYPLSGISLVDATCGCKISSCNFPCSSHVYHSIRLDSQLWIIQSPRVAFCVVLLYESSNDKLATIPSYLLQPKNFSCMYLHVLNE
jgi:hypothetical protein